MPNNKSYSTKHRTLLYNYLYIFWKGCENGLFNTKKAATAHGTSDTNIRDNIIIKLENNFGILYNKIDKRLTTKGNYIYNICSHVFPKLEQIEDHARNVVKIGFTQYIANNFLSAVDPINNDLNIHLHQEIADDLYRLLLEGKLDFVLVPVKESLPDGIKSICDQRFPIEHRIVSSSQVVSQGNPMSWNATKKFQWVSYEEGTATYKAINKVFKDYITVETIAITSDEISIIQLVSRGTKKVEYIPENMASHKGRRLAVVPWGPEIEAAATRTGCHVSLLPEEPEWPVVHIGILYSNTFLPPQFMDLAKQISIRLGELVASEINRNRSPEIPSH